MTSLLSRARRWTLPLSLGLSDGILNALILAAAALLNGGAGITVDLALRVGCSTKLGRRVRMKACQAGLVASVSSFAGAVMPLLIAGPCRAKRGSVPWTPWRCPEP